MTLHKILEQLLTILKAKAGPSKTDTELEVKVDALSRRIKILEDERNEAIVLAQEIREVVDKWES
jgi:hypothetical protein